MLDTDFTLVSTTVQFVPPGFKKVVDAIGIKNAAKLLDALPGVQIYPACKKKTKGSKELAALIGADAVLKLSAVISKQVHIPTKSALAVKVRHAAIVAAYKAGKGIEEIICDSGLCQRQIYEIIKPGGGSRPERGKKHRQWVEEYQGEAVEEFAAKHNISRSWAMCLLRKYGKIEDSTITTGKSLSEGRE